MTKRLSAVVGEYTDKQTNQPKAEWQNIGIIGIGKNGKEYVLLDPSISLSGVLAKQNVLAMKRNEPLSDMVMTSVFEDSNQAQQGGHSQQQSYQQQVNAPQYGQQQAPYTPPQNSGQNMAGQQAPQPFSDDIPF